MYVIDYQPARYREKVKPNLACQILVFSHHMFGNDRRKYGDLFLDTT